EIAGEGEGEPSTSHRATEHGNGGLGDLMQQPRHLDATGQILHPRVIGGLAGAALSHGLDVPAGAEAASGPPQKDDPDLAVDCSASQRSVKKLEKLRGEGVEPFRSVHG